MESTQLHVIGSAIFNAFAEVASASGLDQLSRHHSVLVTEEQRFRLWAHSLGLHRQGHSSLDYRLRDAVIIKEGLIEVLTDLQGHLEELVAIAQGSRGPLDDEPALQEQDDDNESLSSGSVSTAALSSPSSSQSDGSFHEVDFRMHSIVERIDALFTFAVKIRNPRNRPQRTLEQLFMNISIEQLPTYIREREDAETAVVSHIHRQQLLQDFVRDDLAPSGSTGTNRNDILKNYIENSEWLLRRVGCSNVRRKQQFTFWRTRAQKTVLPTQEIKQLQTKKKLSVDTDIEPTTQVPPSNTISATRYVENPHEALDRGSVVSHRSRISTTITPHGEKLEWPGPPPVPVIGSYFTCPYCSMLCPRKYLSANAWRVHLAHDLQPYQCTYKNCDDERRIYGTREEWLEHEAQHSLAWHCRLHAVSEEFETRAEYKLHLRNEHPDAPPELSSEELIANAVAQSEHPRRDCPLCPTPLSTSFERQKHMIYHLERFALFALPLLEDDEESQQSDHPSRSNRGQNIGREQSIACDFSQGAISFSTDANDTSAAIDNTIIEEASLVSEPRFQGHDFQNYHVDPQGKPDGTTSRKSPAPIMRIAVAGGGGFAELLVQELSRTANSVMVLSRAPHAEFEANYDCQVVVVDYRNIDSLQYTLQGVDLVISTFSGAEQLNLIDAARRARVRTFVPSEFGGPLTMTPAPKFGPFDKGSSAALERLRHWASSRHNPMKYTVFSCGMFYEHFGPGGLEAYNIMGTTCRHCLGGTFIDIQLGKAELPDGNSQGHPVLINLTSAVDVARFVAAAVELGIDSWPLEFTMRGACITPQRIQTLCSEVRQVQFEVISRPYAEIIAWIDYYENHSDEERWLAMQQLLQIADGRYTFESANLNELVDFEPMGFRQWLYDNWGPREDRDTDEKAIKAERQLETPEKLDLRIHLGEATAH